MLVDYHVHTHFCGHARGSIEDLVLSAIQKGFSHLGIADHMPLTYTDDRALSMSPEELPFYVEQVLEMKEKYAGEISIRLGIEADYEPHTIDKIEKMIDSHPFDYVLGSVHFVDGWIFDDPRQMDKYERINLEEFYLRYYRILKEMAETGLYDILSHPDLPKKFGYRPNRDFGDAYREVLGSALENDMCYELNTSGLRWPASEIYPENSFIGIASELGIPVTLGSDAHCPEDIGSGFERAESLLREYGYCKIATFEKRRMNLVSLDS
ncbi:MAG: histidinol-phosphatase HisJ family protein [Actinomycetota bacterium]|nr:histidinol-phosphatase HisJ family protein [Actinomycetota bacterium]